MVPFTPSSTSSVAAFPAPRRRPRTPRAARLDDDEPYPSRREGSTRQSAVDRALLQDLAIDEAWARDVPVEPGSAIASQDLLVLRTVAVDLAVGARESARAHARAPAREPVRASPGCDAPRRRRPAAPAAGSSRLEWAVVLPLEARQLAAKPARAVDARAAARNRRRAAEHAGTRAERASRSGRRAPRGTRASSPRSRSRASRRRCRNPLASACAAAASSEKYGNDAVWTTS